MRFSGLELFLDDEMIAYTRNIRRQIVPARKYEGNPVLRRQFPWEARHACIYGSVLYDQPRRIFRMWYNAYGENRVTGHKGDDPFWGPGEAEFSYWGGGGGKLCITSGEGGPCESEYTRDMPCSNTPPVEDLFAAGYCDCCEAGATLERCRERINNGTCFKTGNAHYSWRVVFKRAN